MKVLNLTIIHSLNGRSQPAEVPSNSTGQELIDALIAGGDLLPDNQGYKLRLKGGAELANDLTLEDSGVKDGDTLQVYTATDAG